MAEQAGNGAAAPAEAVPSAKAFAQRVAELAYASAGKPAPPPPGADKAAVPLVPIYVGIDRNVERNGATVEDQLRETFLYRLGDPKWSVKSAASRLMLETGLPGNSEKVVQDQINAGLKPYQEWSRSGQQQLVELQFYVRQGERVFRDEVVWDVGNPHNVAEPYAVRVCADLGLGADWFDAIRAHVQQQLQDVKQDLREAPHEVQLQQPVTKMQRRSTTHQKTTQAGGPAAAAAAAASSRRGVPRLEPYDAAGDVEAARVAARQQKLQQRPQQQQVKPEQAVGQQQQGQVQQQQQMQQQQMPQQQQQQQQPGQVGPPQPHMQPQLHPNAAGPRLNQQQSEPAAYQMPGLRQQS